ncbi:MAG: hypothetical protein A2Y34_08235, partial [Spirochaetes bacterium GWC1_27_15]
MLKLILEKRRIILFLALPLVVAGIICVQLLPIKLYPNTRKPIVSVNIPCPSYSAEDFHSSFNETIENQIKTIKDVDNVESTYSSRRTQYRIEFGWNIDTEEAKLRVQTAFNAIKGNLPDESQNFEVSSWSSNTGFMSIAVYSKEMEQKKLFEIVEPILKSKLSKIYDADSIDVINIEELTAKITCNIDSMLTYGITADEIATSIRNNYKNISVGSFTEKTNQFNVRVKRGIDSVFDIQNILVGIRGNKKILLKDVANVTVKFGVPDHLYSANGERSILIYARPKEGGNLKKMSQDVRKAIDDAKKLLPSHTQFEYLIDPAVFIDNAVNNVINSAIIGGILAILAIMFFLGEFRNTLIIALSIPLSIIFSFILMYAFGLTINLISLSGLALAVGMIVDASIVIIENIHRHRNEALHHKKTLHIIQIILNSVNEVRSAIIASTITSVCVFFPLSFTSPLTNAILGDIAKTVIFSLSCSMFTALLVIPVLAYYMFRKDFHKKHHKKTIFQKFSQKITDFMIKVYLFFLKRLLKSKIISIIFMISSFGMLVLLLMFVFPKIKKEIIADPKSDKISVFFTNFTTTDKEQLLEKIRPIEDEILKLLGDKYKNRFANIFRERAGNLIIGLKSSKYLEESIDLLKEKLISNTEWRFEIYPWDPSQLPLPRTYGLEIKVNGPDKSEVLNIMEKMIDVITKDDIYRSIFSIPSLSKSKEIILKPRDEVINNFSNYNVNKLATIAKIALTGTPVISMNEKDRKIDITINYTDNYITNVDTLKNLQLYYDNKGIPFKHFFDFDFSQTLSEIRAINGETTYSIFANLKRGTNNNQKKQFEKIIKERLAK